MPLPEKMLNFCGERRALADGCLLLCTCQSAESITRPAKPYQRSAALHSRTEEKTRLNREDLGPTPGMMAGGKIGWHKRRISGMGPSSKLGPPKITRAEGRRVFVCAPQLGLQFAVGGTLTPVFRQLQQEC